MTPPDAGQAKPSSRSDSDVNTRLIEDLRDITQIMHNATAIRALAAEAASTIERLRGVEADARRYRWLRDKSEKVQCGFYLSVGEALKDIRFEPQSVDNSIDAAIAASRSTGAADLGGRA